MSDIEKDWPPLILSSQRPAWIRWRDAILTTAAWLLVILMLMSQFRLLLGHYVEFDTYSVFRRLGLSQSDVNVGLVRDLVRLAPYFLIVFLLLAFLSTFALHTLTRRRQTLQEGLPQPLALATQSRNAALGAMHGYVGAATEAHYARLDEATIDNMQGNGRPIGARTLRAAMMAQDRAALEDARSLQISEVHIDSEGKYHIEDANETSGKS